MILQGNPNLVVSATAVLQIWKPLVEARSAGGAALEVGSRDETYGVRIRLR